MKNKLTDSLQEAFNQLLALLQSLDEASMNKVPFEGSWTAAQVGEHLYLSYSVLDCLTGNVAPTTRDPKKFVQPLSEAFLNFSIKMQSPEFILPSQHYFRKVELLQRLQQQTGLIMDFVRSDADMEQTCLDFELPGVGTLTRYEWINFVLVHTLRHNKQIATIIEHQSNI